MGRCQKGGFGVYCTKYLSVQQLSRTRSMRSEGRASPPRRTLLRVGSLLVMTR